MEYTQETIPPPIFHRWTAVCMLSAALQRKVYARAGLGAEFYPNFFSFLVGEPGTGKSTAIGIGENMLLEAGITIEADSSTTAGLQGAFKDAWEKEAAVVGDDRAHGSVIVVADELETFLKNERYDSELIKLLTKAYNCPVRLRHKTKQDGKIEVPNIFLTILGGIQPDNLNKQIPPQTVGSGFASRVTFIYHPPQHVPYCWEMKEKKGPVELHGKLINDLKHIATLQGQYAVTPAFKKMWDRVGTESANAIDCPLGKNLITYWRRRITHLTKLAIVFAASRSDKLLLDRCDLERALETLTEAEQHMPYVIGSLTTTEEQSLRRDVVRALEKHGAKTAQQMYEPVHDELSFMEFQRVLKDLHLGGRIEMHRKGQKEVYSSNSGEDA
jgi:hypothetical protein